MKEPVNALQQRGLLEKAIVGSLVLLVGLAGCAADPSASQESHEDWTSDEVSLAATPGYAEFRAASVREGVLGQYFVVETDLAFEQESQLLDYYGKMIRGEAEKSIVNLSGGARTVRSDSNASTNETDISFCFDNSSWGGTESGDTDGDGNSNEDLPTKANVLAALQDGMRAWEGVANVRFSYEASNDGSSCSGASDLVVTLDDTKSCTASGAFPPGTAITVPICGLPNLLAEHELGHVLGFRHEHIHSGDPNQCDESGAREELTSFDIDSCMIYANCASDGFIANNPVSMLDGVGARILYGNPNWWWGALI